MLIRPESKSSSALYAAVKISLFCMTLFCIQAPVQARIPGFGAVEAPKGESSAEAAEETAPEAIAIADLPVVSLETMDRVKDMRGRLPADSSLLAISDLIPSAGVRVDSLCIRSEELLGSDVALRRLRNLQSDWQGLLGELGEWQGALSVRIEAIGLEVEELARMKEVWRLTGDRAPQDRLPAEVVEAISRTIEDIETTESVLYKRRNRLLLLEYTVAELQARCRHRAQLASEEADRMRDQLLVADAAPLWSRTAISGADEGLATKTKNTLADHVQSFRAYVRNEPDRIGLHLIIFLFSIICVAVLGRYAAAHSEGDPVMEGAARTLKWPIPAAVLIAVLLDGAVHASPPGSWTLILDVLLIIPLVTLMPRLAGRCVRPAIYVLAVVYLLDTAFDVLPQHSFVGRLLRLVVKIVLIITSIWLMRGLYRPSGTAPGTRRKLATIGLGLVTGLLAASALAGILGNVSLSTLLLEGTLGSIYLGLPVWLGIVVLRSIVTVILKTGMVKRNNLVRKHGAGLRLGILASLSIAGILLWLAVTLDGFKILLPLYEGINRTLASSLRIGSLEIATGDIVLFVIIVWLSFLVSRILRAILREEVYPRVRLAHGVPMAISRLAHYAILLIGFFFAMGAAGIDFSRFTLLAGALGVGIGFGLQNIVNNLVSGLFVLFERPVQIGDKVRIGTNDGEIRRIGLRATIIRTWEGSEVIIPNSRLILDEVTNWTLSDQMRRIDVHVGVAYGTDTDRVMEVLLKVAKDHDEVLEYPQPTALFTGFGDSSLNFSLRAWTDRFGEFLRVGSELTSGVNKALAEAGITIPFPQRDVHMNPGENATGEST